MITVALLVVLGAAAVLGDCPISCPPKCSNTWTSFLDHKVRLLNYKSGISSEGACKAACEADHHCWNLDWDFDKSSCWFGYTENPQPKVADKNVNHHDLARTCVENCDLTNTWTTYPNKQVKNLVQQHPKYNTEEKCKNGCQANSTCWNIDWNFVKLICFFGYTQNPDARLDDPDVNHHDLARACA